MGDDQVHLLLRHQRAHRVDRMRRGAEFVATMDEGDAAGDRVEVERPVERRIAAAGDQHPAAAEMLHLAHRIEDALAFVGLDAGGRRALGLERAAAGGDDHHLGLDRRPGVGRDAITAASPACRAFRPARPSRRDGRSGRTAGSACQRVDQPLAGDDRIAGNVVDRLLRIKLGALTADLGQDVDQVGLDIEQTELEHGEQADRAGADDDGVRLNDLAHVV